MVSAPTISVFKKKLDNLWLVLSQDMDTDKGPVPKLLFLYHLCVYPLTNNNNNNNNNHSRSTINTSLAEVKLEDERR